MKKYLVILFFILCCAFSQSQIVNQDVQNPSTEPKGITILSATNFTSQQTAAFIGINRKQYRSIATGSGNDRDDKVGIWIKGYYHNVGESLPIYLGGTGFDSEDFKMVIENNGNVGIGASPSAKLHVVGVDNEQIRAVGTGASRSGVYAANSNSQGQAGFLMENDRGTYNSYGALVVGGSQNNWTPIFGLNRNDKVFLLADGDSNLGMGIGTVKSAPLIIGTNNQERLRIDADGNVAIGTPDAEGYKLAVKGDAIFTKIKVKQHESWPDYVFHKNYQLRPLHELEAFIKKNNHLPEVPSAADVKVNGIDVAENQAALLKKIEELTLYIIEQNKRIEVLEKSRK